MTPMMKQYFEIKDKYRDCILFYRLGDFYEMFFEDAQIASRELDLTMTGRDCGEEKRAPMCGVPYHACDSYIGKLIEKGYKVAICEQTEDPAATKNIVRREVVRVITPGTVIDSDFLDSDLNNYLCTIYNDGISVGICFSDISTAFICATSKEFRKGKEENITEELSIYAPKEIISNVSREQMSDTAKFITERLDALFTDGASGYFDEEACMTRVREQFGDKQIDGKPRAALIAVGAALKYIAETQMMDISYIKMLSTYDSSEFLEMDISTRRNLELCETMLKKEKEGSLLWVLDNTGTSMGARLLKSYIEHPLTNVSQIIARQEAVAELKENFILREDLRETLSPVLDLERLATKVSNGSPSARDLRAIAQTIRVLPTLKNLLDGITAGELTTIREKLDTLEDILSVIDDAIIDSPPYLVRDGGIIRDGYDPTVDKLRYILNNGKSWFEKVEADEKEKTGIKSLKIGNNRVFGYYIEVPRSASNNVPDSYIRKQTLSDKERFITDELKEMEETVLGAKDNLNDLEYDLFCEVRKKVADAVTRLRESANAMARLDVFVSLAEAASKNEYVRPEVDNSDTVKIKEGRHPVVERYAKDSYFVPNDTYLNTTDNRLALITGPNMAGKSTYMRQTALIVLMAQIGSFVPAAEARVGIVDRLFTRVGASDDLASGQSTFMLEMREVAYILNNATKKSFIIYDEIGRGTSTYDGMSIARAVVEYTMGQKLGAKTMFATHYHELTSLEGEVEGVVNYNIAAKKRENSITFLRKIVRGPTDDSYGIEVARLAGVPNEVTRRAKQILKELEAGSPTLASGQRSSSRESACDDAESFDNGTISMLENSFETVADEIRSTDLNTITPIEAMNLIFEWKKQLM